MNNCIIYNNSVEWNEMQICSKKSCNDATVNKCDFELDNPIPECIYKGPNTAVHLCKVSVKSIIDAIQYRPNYTTEINDSNHIMKTCILLLFVPSDISNKQIDIYDNKLQSLRQIEKNDKRLNKWKKDNNFVINHCNDNIKNSYENYNSDNNIERIYIDGYISKHGNYNLPISFRELEIFSNPLIIKELHQNIDKNLLMILEHRKENSKPYGLWDYSTVGGGFIIGESPENCIIRETYEESGILLNEKQLNKICKIKLPCNKELKIENPNTVYVFKSFI